MFSEFGVLAAVTSGFIPWIEVEVKEDDGKSEVERVG